MEKLRVLRNKIKNLFRLLVKYFKRKRYVIVVDAIELHNIMGTITIFRRLPLFHNLCFKFQYLLFNTETQKFKKLLEELKKALKSVEFYHCKSGIMKYMATHYYLKWRGRKIKWPKNDIETQDYRPNPQKEEEK